MHSEYGIDVEDRALMTSRSWRWLKGRIVGLLSCESRLQRHFAPDPDDEEAKHGAQPR